jgi:hypothetical protein
MRHVWFWTTLPLTVACTAPIAGGPKDPTGTHSADVPTDTAAPPPTIAVDDAALVADLVAGEAALDDVLGAVAASGGWPVPDGDTVWFVRPGSGSWSVAGDFDDWAGTPMTAASGFSWAQVTVSSPAGQRYKFTDGPSWEPDRWARSYEYDANGEISFVAPPGDRPRLDRWVGLAGRGGVAPRELRVHVPPGDGPWPVLFAMDGQNLFDPAAIWGGWRLTDALASRDDVLVVGIDNTPDRFEDYTHVPDDVGYGGEMGGNADAYADYVEDVVRPLIEGEYGAGTATGVMGSSLGGLVSLVIAQDHPGRYDFAASLSGDPGVGPVRARRGDGRGAVSSRRHRPTRWCTSTRGAARARTARAATSTATGSRRTTPDSSDNYCETRQFADALAGAGFVWDDTLFHWWEPDATHDELAWSRRVGAVVDRFLAVQ